MTSHRGKQFGIDQYSTSTKLHGIMEVMETRMADELTTLG